MTQKPKLIEDSFYGTCLELSNTPSNAGSLRIAIVNHNGTYGLDIRRFGKNGKVRAGVFLNSQDQVATLIETLQNSTEVEEFIKTGKFDFTNYQEEEVNNG